MGELLQILLHSGNFPFLPLCLQSVLHDIDSMREEYLRLRERITMELEDMSDPDKAQFLRSEITTINQRLAGLEGGSSAYLQRWVEKSPCWTSYSCIVGEI